MADLFKVANKRKYRFNYKGQISVEDLWDLSVEELDKIYKSLKAKQKDASEESLLQTVSKEDKELLNKIEIIKTIVADKLAAKERALKEKSIEELQSMLIEDEVEDDD